MQKFKINKAPAFQFYAGDFLSDINVQLMTMAQRGIYITLLANEWIEGELPNNLVKLKVLCGNPVDFETDWEAIKHCFVVEDGKLVNNRLEKERGKMVAYRERMSDAGKKGAKTRWQGNGKAIARLSNKEEEREVEVKVKTKKQNKEKDFELEFKENFWKQYPKGDGRKTALEKYIKHRKNGITEETIINGLNAYKKHWKENNTEVQFMPMASTWLHQERFDDELISGNSVIKNLTPVKKEWHYICDGCLKEKTTDFKIVKHEDAICECGEGFFTSKKEHQMIQASKKMSKKPLTRKEENIKAENLNKVEFDKSFNSMLSKIGV